MLRTRTKFLYNFGLCLIGTLAVWAVLRFLVVPPLLNDTNFSRAYYDCNGKLLRITLAADDKYRIYTPLEKISPWIQRAVVLYEDRHFYNHIGINPISLVRATKQYISGTPHPVGASTITMQIARLKYNINTKHPLGKLEQIAAAIYIDLFYSKHEILEAYLNLAPFGGNLEGIGAASVIYFDKQASDLSKIESITLATIPQNPTKRGLNTARGLANMERMRKDLVARWIAENPQDQELNSFAQMPLAARKPDELPFLTPHFLDNLNTQELKEKTTQFHTTIDLGLQTAMEKTIKKEINTRRNLGVTNAAAILLNYKTMDVLAYIGSADYFNREIFGENDGVRARRSPGSTLKPLIYANATDLGLIHPMTLLRDARTNFGVYAPENADNEFYGPVLARDALTHSRNIPAINLVRQIGIQNFYKTMVASGIGKLKSADHYGVSVALGGAEVSMLELADIYATMANLGQRKRIRFLTDTPNENINRVLSPEAYFLTLDMLSHAKAPIKKIPFARDQETPLKHYWKTGTSSSYRDAWTAGIFGDMVLIVWVGNFDGQPNNSFSGAKVAAPIYFSLADTVTRYYKSRNQPLRNHEFLTPELNVILVDMCTVGGGIAGTYCPNKTKSWFIPGKSPIAQNRIHRSIPIDNKTGLRACVADPKTTHNEVFEFWDAEYLDMFRHAGIRRKTPPEYMPNCDFSQFQTEEAEPIILSPMADTAIVITSANDTEPVAFIGLSSDEKSRLFWSLDDKILGSTGTGETLKYNVKIGNHTLRVTDSNGIATQIQFDVVK